jgi:hypothetical protein
VSTGRRSPQRKIFEGVEYFSVQKAAEVLNRTPRTLRRLEQAGVISRPRHELPHSRPNMRWYSAEDLEQLQKLVEESGFAEGRTGSRTRLKGLLDDLSGVARTAPKKSSWAGEEVSRRPREMLGWGKDIEAEWTPPSEHRRINEHRADPIPPAETCKGCGQEVLWIALRLPGGGIEQRPWCERCGPVDLSEPEPDLEHCSCGRELLWELQEGVEGFQPACETCGPVKLPAPARVPRALEERPFAHQVSFNLPPPEIGRARGLREGEIPGAVRKPRAQPGPKVDIMLPSVGPTRSS